MLTIYKASAGSGKTYTLAYEYIKLLLGVRPDGTDGYVLNSDETLKPLGLRADRRPHSHILAITFTNKATAEMKARIIRELDALSRMPGADGKDAAYAADLVGEYGCTRRQLADAAGTALRGLLNDYGSFNVSTIDSFFQTVLRTFAREIDRQGDYRVELEPAYVLGASLGMMFDELRDGTVNERKNGVFRWLRDHAGARMAEGKDFNPFLRGSSMYRSLLKWLADTFSEDFAPRAQALRDYLADPTRLERYAEALKIYIQERQDEIFNASALIVHAHGEMEGMNRYLRATVRGLVDSQGAMDPKKEESLLFPSSKYMSALAGRVEEACFNKGAEEYYYELFDWYAAVTEALVLLRFARGVLKSLDSLWAMAYIHDYISRFRIDNNLILLADTNTMLRTIISDEEAPFIYERIGQPLRHFLIDEFQDTSAMQWHNLKPLVGNSLGSQHDSLIIGDVKQSIYRWRGGDSSLLDHVVAEVDFPGKNNVRGAAPGENTNHRSAHTVVRFNNTLFSRLAADCGIGGYGGVEQSLAGHTAGLTGHVSVTDLRAGVPDPENPGELTRDKETVRDTALENMAAALLAQHDRGYRWRDMAILCRTNDEIRAVADFLLGRYADRIPMMSEEALLVAYSQSVKQVVSFLEMLDKTAGGCRVADTGTQETDTSGTPIVRSRADSELLTDRFEYFLSHGREASEALREAMDFSIKGAVEGSGGIEDDLEAIRAQAPANLVALVEAVIERRVPDDRRRAEFAYLAAFQDAVVDFSNNYNPTVHAFLDYWTQKSGTLTIGAGAGQDAVTLMTVHKAKGLEWDCVHIPLLKWDLTAAPEKGWFDMVPLEGIPADLTPPTVYYSPTKSDTLPGSPVCEAVCGQIEKDTADNLNVVYVAFTRAVRELHVQIIPRTDNAAVTDPMWTALCTPQLASEAGSPLYEDTAAALVAPDRLELGSPTFADNEDYAGPEAEAPSVPPYRVSFRAATRAVTSLEDLTVKDNVMDPYIGEMSPKEITDDVTPQTDSYLREAARRGLALHAILARMRTLDDLDRAVAAESADFTPGEAEEFRQTVISAFRAHPDESGRWFAPDAPRVLVEQPIYDPVRGENFRPDRMVWTADGHVDIIDYKFTVEEKESHRRQVRHYGRLLGQMGITGVRCYLWYPALRRLTELRP